MGNTYEDAKEAITEMFGNDAYSKDECIENLEALRDEIDLMIEGLEGDL